VKYWRTVHRYCFGYLKALSVVTGILMVLISLTGILYNHHHDIKALRDTRIPTGILPSKYQERLDRTRSAQGTAELFPEEAHSVPVMWLVIDLHNGEFFGPWGRLVYDVIGVMFVCLAVTGIYMYLCARKR
jgi:hypothetical protein